MLEHPISGRLRPFFAGYCKIKIRNAVFLSFCSGFAFGDRGGMLPPGPPDRAWVFFQNIVRARRITLTPREGIRVGDEGRVPPVF